MSKNEYDFIIYNFFLWKKKILKNTGGLYRLRYGFTELLE